MLSIIDRYIGKQFLGYFLAGLCVFVTIFVAADFTSTVMRFEVGMDVFGRYYLYYLPAIVNQMVPVACLIATLFTLSAMNKSNELVSLFSMGVSLARVALPILVLVGVISMFSFWLGDRVLPRAVQAKDYIYYVEMKKKPNLYSQVKQDKIWYRYDNIIFNISVFSPENTLAQGVTMYYFDDAWHLIQMIRAQIVKMRDTSWDMEDGSVTLFTDDSSFPLTRTFRQKTITMSEDLAEIKAATPSSGALSLSGLGRYIEKNKALGLDTRTFEVDYHGKLAFAFAGFILSLIAIPFTTKQQRQGGAMMNIAFCALLGLVYWVLFSAGLSIGKHGSLPPMIAAWGANVLMLGVALFLFKRRA